MLLLSTGDFLAFTELGDLFTPTQLTAGDYHVCALGSLSSSQEIKCWGRNSNGQLGQGIVDSYKGGVLSDMGMYALRLFQSTDLGILFFCCYRR